MIRLPIAIITLYLTATACANIGTVEGGPVDQTPPEIINTVPKNENLFFEQKSFTLFFDEFIKPGGLSNDISVSPPLNTKAKGTIRGKMITVEWEDTLKENTTYVFQFGEGIKDLNEGNILKNYIYVFSTGDHIDSLTVTGKIKTVEDKKPMGNAVVGLYPWNGEQNDSTPINQKPYYYNVSEESGAFTLRYLKEGEYRLVVFDDENGNFKYDPDLEKGGFLPYPINPLNDDDDMLEIRAFTPIPKLRKLEERIIHKHGIRMVFNRPADTLTIDAITPAMPSPMVVFNTTKDSALIWFEEELPDSLKFVYTTRSVSDTVSLKKRSLKEFKYKNKPVFGKELAPDKKAMFTANIPVKKIDTTGIIIRRDTLSWPIDSLEIEPLGTYTLHFRRKGSGSYNITLPPKAITYLDNQQNTDSVRLKFEVLEKDEYGKLELNIHPGRQDSLLIEILIGESSILKTTITDSVQLLLPYIKPGSYRMEAIVDWNGNGRWDPGDFLQNRLSEPIISNSDEVQIKANWDIEYTWNIPADEIKRPIDFLKLAKDSLEVPQIPADTISK